MNLPSSENICLLETNERPLLHWKASHLIHTTCDTTISQFRLPSIGNMSDYRNNQDQIAITRTQIEYTPYLGHVSTIVYLYN